MICEGGSRKQFKVRYRLPRKRNAGRRKSAFTLVEVLVALVILTLALMFLVELNAQAAQITAKARFERIAAGIAQDWVERSIGSPYSTLSVTLDVNYPVSSFYITPMPANANIHWVSRPLDNNPANTRIQEIWVTVSWSNSNGADQSNGSVVVYTLATPKQ